MAGSTSDKLQSDDMVTAWSQQVIMTDSEHIIQYHDEQGDEH